MEGVIDLSGAFGSPPAGLWLAALAYQTADGGVLASQAPAMTADNGDVDPDELLMIPLEALRDEDADGTYDRLQPGAGFRITSATATADGLSLTWNCFPGRSYQVQSSATPAAGSWADVPGGGATAGAADLTLSRTLPRVGGASFFRVVLLPPTP